MASLGELLIKARNLIWWRRRMNAFGVDLSHWNGTVKDLDHDIEFVLHKATEGATHVDEKYKNNKYTITHRYPNIVWGAYHVIRETSLIKNQCNNFFEFAELKQSNTVALDLEHKHAEAMIEKFGKARSMYALVYFAQQCWAHHKVRPLLYASKRSLSEIVTTKAEAIELADYYDLWLVDYDPTLDWRKARVPKLDWWAGRPLMRQYTSSGLGTVIGQVGTKVDYNVCFNLTKLKWNAAK